MNNAGITSQYGFLYQRKAFILHTLENANTKQTYTFEGKDDIEVAPEESIYIFREQGTNFIQVKSGTVDDSCFCKVVCNWLLLDVTSNDGFYLICENPLTVEFGATLTQKVVDYIIEGKKKKKSAVARQAYEKFKSLILSKPEEMAGIISTLIDSIQYDICGLETLDIRLEKSFFANYCQDIVEYDLAKTKRLERLISYINQEIDSAIKVKKPYVLSYANLMKLILQVCDEINDHHYTVKISDFKKKSRADALKIVEEKTAREVRQLYLVDQKESFVLDGIVQELLYKDFRDVYIAKKEIEIANIEENAHENYSTAISLLDESEVTIPKKVFNKTIDMPIGGDLIPDGIVYRKGCYIYLTGEGIEPDTQITWGDSNDEK